MTGGVYKSQTVTTAVPLDLSGCPAATRFVAITVEGGALRIRIDGTDPTAAVGSPVPAGSSFDWTFGMASVARVVAQSGAVTVHIVPLTT